MRPDPLRLLVVEHDPIDAELCRQTLEHAGFRLEIAVAATAAQLEAALARARYDVALTDFQLEGWTGPEVLDRIRACDADLPVIVVTGTLGEELAVDLLKQGFADYVIKDRLARLPVAIDRALAERRLATAARVRDEELTLLRSAIDQIGEAVMIVVAAPHPDAGRIAFANPAFWTMTRLPNDPSTSPERLRGPRTDPGALERMREVLTAGGSWDGELVLQRGDGTGFVADLRAAPLRAADGTITHYVFTLADVSERAILRERVERGERLEAIGRLAGGVAHDFNNLLLTIVGNAELLAEALPPDHPGRADVAEIARAAQQGAALTGQLLSFGRRQVRQPRPLDLNALVSEARRMLARLIGEDIELRTELDPTIGPIVADPAQIHQAILNLAANARDAMPGGGRLTLSTSRIVVGERFEAWGAPLLPGPHVRLEVTDTGVGMHPDALAHLFEPFFTTKERGRGTGLGLASVYAIAEQSGAAITVASVPGRGTTIGLVFPETSGQVAEEAPPAAVAGRGAETILLVEDDDSVRDLARRILAKRGYTVHVAANGPEAIGLVERLERPPDLLLTDVIMPGLSGPRLAEELGARLPRLRVLFMSGYTENALAPHGVLAPGIAFLQKPFTPVILASKVREVLDGA